MKTKITLIKNVKCKNCGREIPIVDKSIECGTAIGGKKCQNFQQSF
jgi:hypothetical protein